MAKNKKTVTKTATIETAVVVEETQNTVLPEAEKQNVSVSDEIGLFNSKKFKNGNLEFPLPAELFSVPLSYLEKTGGSIRTLGSDKIENVNEDGSVNTAFGRAGLIATYPIDNEISYEIGFLYALDLRVPKLRLFRGPRVHACSNLCVFGADETLKIDITAGFGAEIVNNFISKYQSEIERVRRVISGLKGILIAPEQFEHMAGKLAIKGLKDNSVGVTTLLDGIRHCINPTGKYYYKNEDFNAWHLYNAFTENMNEKISFFDIPEKAANSFSLIAECMTEDQRALIS